MGDQDHDSFFRSIMLKNIDNQIPIAFDKATPSKTTTPTTKSPSSIFEKERYKDKKCDQITTNHLKQELFYEIKHYISSLHISKPCRTKLRLSKVRLCFSEGK